jgi:hypothetical protein
VPQVFRPVGHPGASGLGLDCGVGVALQTEIMDATAKLSWRRRMMAEVFYHNFFRGNKKREGVECKESKLGCVYIPALGLLGATQAAR